MRRLHSIVIGMLCALVVGAWGEPAGAWHFEFTAEQLPVWDFSGDYSRSNGNNAAQLTLAHQPSGKLTGGGSADLATTTATIHATENSIGTVTGGAGRTVRIKAKGNGQFSGNAQGVPLVGNFRGELVLALDAAARRVSGRESATFCILGGGCHTVSTNASFPLAVGLDGSWQLSLNTVVERQKIRGDGTATLSSGRIVPLIARGRAGRVTHLRIEGVEGGRFLLTIKGDSELRSVRGRFFGQRLSWTAPR